MKFKARIIFIFSLIVLASSSFFTNEGISSDETSEQKGQEQTVNLNIRASK